MLLFENLGWRLLVVVGRSGRRGGVGGLGEGRLELGSDDIVEEAGEDVVLAEVLDKLCVVLFELLNEIALVEKVFETKVGLVENSVNGGDVGVAAKTPKHGGGVEGAPAALAGLSDGSVRHARRGRLKTWAVTSTAAGASGGCDCGGSSGGC